MVETVIKQEVQPSDMALTCLPVLAPLGIASTEIPSTGFSTDGVTCMIQSSCVSTHRNFHLRQQMVKPCGAVDYFDMNLRYAVLENFLTVTVSHWY